MGESEMKMDEQHAGSPTVQNEDKKSDITAMDVVPVNTKNTAIIEECQESEEQHAEDVVENGVDVDANKQDEQCDDVDESQEVIAGNAGEQNFEKQMDECQEQEVEVMHEMDTELKFNEEDIQNLHVEHGEEIDEDVGKNEETEGNENSSQEQQNVEIDYTEEEAGMDQNEFDDKDEQHLDEEETEDNENAAGSDGGVGSILEDALKNGANDNNVSLNKIHMEDVREGCDSAQPSSPGHADQSSELPPRELDSPCDDSDTIQQTQESTYPKLEDDTDEDKSPKRKNLEDDDEIDEPAKRLKKEIQQETYLRNKILMEYTEALDTSSIDHIQQEEDKLFDEIQNLDDIAREKEREWNNIIHMKKMKEELLLRIQRQKQLCMIANGLDVSISDSEQKCNKQQIQNLAKRLQQHNLDMNGHDLSKGRNKGPVRNVQSIIADYRQRHPEMVPRRGRRIRNINGNSSDSTNCNNGKTSTFSTGGGTLTFANMALGSGAQVRPMDSNSEIALLLSSMENANSEIMVQNDCQESSNTYKEYLDQIENSERKKASITKLHPQQPPPLTSQYPEVTVHAVTSSSASTNAPTNSLLHGILTKTQAKTDSRTTFSPTLARLLTAPDKTHTGGTQPNKSSSNVSISDILSTNKTRSEITITPVANDYDDGRVKRKHHVEEETEDSVDRLVIDESTDLGDSRTDNNSDTGDDVPQCQGCNQKAAQFVCAGCGNQWYCSRECQVTAWDEHSDVCSG